MDRTDTTGYAVELWIPYTRNTVDPEEFDNDFLMIDGFTESEWDAKYSKLKMDNKDHIIIGIKEQFILEATISLFGPDETVYNYEGTASVYYHMGRVYENRGKNHLAEYLYRRSIEYSPLEWKSIYAYAGQTFPDMNTDRQKMTLSILFGTALTFEQLDKTLLLYEKYLQKHGNYEERRQVAWAGKICIQTGSKFKDPVMMHSFHLDDAVYVLRKSCEKQKVYFGMLRCFYQTALEWIDQGEEIESERYMLFVKCHKLVV